MASDITWKQFQAQIGEVGTVEVKDGVVTINVNLVTGKTYLDLNSAGVTEFVHKFVDGCNRAQAMVNQNLLPAEHLQSFPDSYITPPQQDSDGKNISISTQQVVTKLVQGTGEVLTYQP
jgi:hypothetical protein